MSAWPSTLPGAVASTLSIEPQTALARTEMDAGPARVRRRYSATPAKLSMRLALTRTQYAVLEAWYHHELHDGADWFTFPLANGQGVTLANCRFVQPPTASLLDNEAFDVAVVLETQTALPVMSQASLQPYL